MCTCGLLVGMECGLLVDMEYVYVWFTGEYVLLVGMECEGLCVYVD